MSEGCGRLRTASSEERDRQCKQGARPTMQSRNAADDGQQKLVLRDSS